MAYRGRSGIVQVFSGINVLVGFWLIVAPWLLGYVGVEAARTNDILVGIALIVLSAVRVFSPAGHRGISGINALLGVWLILAPWLLGYSEGAVTETINFWNDLIAGLVVIACAWLSAEVTRRIGSLGNE